MDGWGEDRTREHQPLFFQWENDVHILSTKKNPKFYGNRGPAKVEPFFFSPVTRWTGLFQKNNCWLVVFFWLLKGSKFDFGISIVDTVEGQPVSFEHSFLIGNPSERERFLKMAAAIKTP